MSKISEYHKLSVAVRAARRVLMAAEQKVTAYNNEFNLGATSNGSLACINRFDKVIVDTPQTAQVDDGGFVEVCELLDTVSFCKNIKCPMYADHMDYVVALDRYNVAISARRDFVRSIFGRTK